ncbi:MAG: TetR/AcrR family transcriptional regulator [Candidatus Wallbacteria bacterium]|nr:TetR/AcrR family transcriptional regulator [Candidatus Wallbacteria bacterium]
MRDAISGATGAASPAVPVPSPSSRGRATRQKLLKVARGLFARKGFRSVTLPDLARAARLSPGAPYQHFKGKEQIFAELASGFGLALAERLGTAMGPTPAKRRWRQVYCALLEAFAAERDLFALFREAEFAVGSSPHDSLLPVVSRLQELVARHREDAGLPASEPAAEENRILAWCLFALAYFPAVSGSLWCEPDALPVEEVASELARFAELGLGVPAAPLSGRAGPVWASKHLPAPKDELAPGALSRPAAERILAAAEQLFARKGFGAATVSAIARLARVPDAAVSAHFGSKEGLLARVVSQIRGDLVARVARAAAGLEHRAAVEDASLLAFFDFLRARPGVYRIVREAEFVVPGEGRDYYRSLLAPYAAGLARARTARQIRTRNPRVTAQALMGLGHWLGLLVMVDGALRPVEAVEIVRRFLRAGLGSFAPAWPGPGRPERNNRRRGK